LATAQQSRTPGQRNQNPIRAAMLNVLNINAEQEMDFPIRRIIKPQSCEQASLCRVPT